MAERSRARKYTAHAYRHVMAAADSASARQGFEYEISLERREALRLVTGILNRVNDGKENVRIIVRANGQVFAG